MLNAAVNVAANVSVNEAVNTSANAAAFPQRTFLTAFVAAILNVRVYAVGH